MVAFWRLAMCRHGIMLLHFSPGAPRERYFEGLLDLAGATDEERDAFFAEHDNHWL